MTKNMKQLFYPFQRLKIKTIALNRNLHFQKCLFSMGESPRNKKLPWIQVKKVDLFKPHPIIHRFIGLFMFQRVLKYTKTKFDVKEFKLGVKNAIQVVTDLIQTQDPEDRLKSLFGETLHHHVHAELEEMKVNNTNIFLDIASINDLKITGARFVFGEAEPGDEHIINTLGQRIIISETEMEQFEEDFAGENVVAGFKFGKYFSQKAIHKRIRFEIDVVFKSEEILLYYKDKDKISVEEQARKMKPCVCFHKWKFETPIYRNAMNSENSEINSNIYPLDWVIIDINDYLKEKYEAHKENED